MNDKPALRVKRLQDLNVKGKRALVRVDYNVPLEGGKVVDKTRITETLPTLKYLLEAGAGVVLISHLGRPGGKADPKYSLKPVAAELEKLLKRDVRFVPDCVGTGSEKATATVKAGEVVMLENLRFHSEEEDNDTKFSKALSKHGDVFVQDAFGALHRAHASTAGVPKYLEGGVGFLVQKEIEFLDRVIGNPQRPFLAILGGSKVSDKLGVMQKLVERVDKMLVGGAMAYTFLVAQNVSVGKSKVEKDKVEDAQHIVEKAYGRNVECLLPADHMVVPELKADAPLEETQGMAIPPDMIGVDIGSHAIELFTDAIAESKTIFWNGPMGVFEMERFAQGSYAIAKAMAKATSKGAVTIVGGGDSLAVLEKLGLHGKMTHCSTGGGASLEFLEGKALPGIVALSHP